MLRTGSAAYGNGNRLSRAGIWAAPLAVLLAVWLWLAFSSGGYLPGQWLPAGLVLGLFGLVVALLLAYPRRPRQLSFVVLVVFGLYAIWVALSAFWALSTTRVWLESGRTLIYLLVLLLAQVYLTDLGARRVFRYLLMAGAFVLLLACVVRLWSTTDVVDMFFGNRFSYPVTYPNNAAALFLIPFWPLMWLAAGPEEKAPVRGCALGLATGLFGLAVMTQSRGAIWTLAITLVLTFIVSPARLRTLLYLIVPALLMVYQFPVLNRYWHEGAATMGGGPAARTLSVAAVSAAFIGMILGLLEKWVRISRRMKAVFGVVVTLGAVAAISYGSITLTSDAGGPLRWISQTWSQFTEQSAAQTSEASRSSRFAVVDSNGRVDLWRVAWQEFKSEPAIGVGADNFVFGYDELRSASISKPQQPHSLPLQVLAETGIVGAVLLGLGVLLSVGGFLWPRCVAGWRGARGTWLRPSRPTNATLCNPRWGNDSRVYGWETALLVALAFWFIHGSVEWIWQMAGVTIPAFLILAAGLAETDAKAGVLWPRLHERLRRNPGKKAEDAPSADAPSADAPSADAPSADTEIEMPLEQPQGQAQGWEPFAADRRSDRHSAKIRRRERRAARKESKSGRIQPPGQLSRVLRAVFLILSISVVVVTGLPYMSLQYQQSALALARTDGLAGIRRADSARWMQPGDPGPYMTQAAIYVTAATDALTSEDPARAAAVLDNLALAVSVSDRAVAVEPADWSLHYRAGVAALNLLLASEYAANRMPALDYAATVSKVPGLGNWSALLETEAPPPEPGVAAGSLAKDDSTWKAAAYYRNQTRTDLGRLALAYLDHARERRPLESQIREARSLVEQVLQP